MAVRVYVGLRISPLGEVGDRAFLQKGEGWNTKREKKKSIPSHVLAQQEDNGSTGRISTSRPWGIGDQALLEKGEEYEGISF